MSAVDPSTKFYNLVEFPYPSAEGLHVGHVYTYCGADVLGRYRTMNGSRVLQPIGFDSFGIHTENYALKVGEQPKTVTDRTTANYRRQLERIGANWAWNLELRTDDPHYYRWTQWIFIQLFNAGLAVRQEYPAIWCPSCLTVLAFEQVEGDRCERCDSRVTTKLMKQWFFRITAYANDLLDGLEALDWPEQSKVLQREWIGRSTGADVSFSVVDDPAGTVLTAFTTRVDTVFGVTYIAIAPEHPYVDMVLRQASNGREVASYVSEVAGRMGVDRLTNIGAAGRPGIVTDVLVAHPLTGQHLPIVVADYVLADYGTGVVMGVPAHDDRDFSTATTLGLPIVRVIVPGPESTEGELERAFLNDGVLTSSGAYDGLSSALARDRISADLGDRGLGGAVTRYRLHDWLVSRQRYWGTPIPIIYCAACGAVPVPESELPVELPELANFQPTKTGSSPLAQVEDFVNVVCPRCGDPALRETDVLDTFVESSWYFLRYPSRDSQRAAWDPQITHTLLPVDMYAGGREHATRHHLYARFMTRALHDLGWLSFSEPFTRLRLHGLITKDGSKMSKSRGNVVNPDDYFSAVGADNLRAYLLFCGPWEEGGDFSDLALQGMVRFTNRLHALVCSSEPPTGTGCSQTRVAQAVQKVSEDIERLKFNTAIAELMSLTTWLRNHRPTMTTDQWTASCRTLVLIAAPIIPHLAEELWQRLGGQYSVHNQAWPTYDPADLIAEDVELPIQVDGKLRGTIKVPTTCDQDTALAAALALYTVREALHEQQPERVIFVAGRILNLTSQ